MRNDGPAAQELAERVNRQNARPLVRRDLLEGLRRDLGSQGCIVDKDIHAAVKALYPADARLDAGRVGDIAINLINAGRACVLIPRNVGADHLRPSRCELLCDGGTDACGNTGDKGDFSFKNHGVSRLSII
jgi:hypothetical protein